MEIQSANRQHPVPQNVMEVEFKLIGDLTIRQFTYLVLFGGFSGATAYSSIPLIFKWPLFGLLVLMGLGFAFFPLNDIPLDKWFVNYVKAITKPRLRVWKHSINIPYYFTYTAKNKLDTADYYNTKTTQKQKMSLEELLNTDKLKSIDFKNSTDIDNKEKEFYKKLGLSESQKTYIATKADGTKQEKQIISNTAQNNYNDILIKTNTSTTQQTSTVIPTKLTPQHINDELENKNTFTSVATNNSNKQATPPPTIKIEEIIKENEKTIKPDIKLEKTEAEFGSLVDTTLAPNITTQNDVTTDSNIQDQANQTKDENIKLKQETLNYEAHIKELNLLKQKLLKEIENNKYKFLDGKEPELINLKEKTDKLVLEKENKELKDRLKKITTQKIINSDKAGKIEKSPFFASFLLKIKGENLPNTQDTNKTTEEQINIKKNSSDFEGTLNYPEDAETIRKKIKKSTNTQSFKLKGSTIDNMGNIIPDVVIIVKNENKEAVRALKSNSVGEFESSTELEKGNYFIEATKENYIFKVININASENQQYLVKLIGIKQ